MPDVNWNAVFGFWLVADHGSFAAAARSLPRGSIQALQKRVRNLEERDLNLTLFRSRGVKGVELTEAGRRLHQLLDPVFESFDRLVGELHDEVSGPLTVSMSSYVSENYRAALISRFHQQFPAVTVTVAERPLPEVMDLVTNGQADFGMGSPPLSPSKLQISGRVPICFEVLAPPAFRLARRHMTWSELIQQPLVLPERGSVVRRAFEELVVRRRLDSRLRIACEVSTEEAAVEAVSAGYGLAIIPIGPRLARNLGKLRRMLPPRGLPRIDVAVFCRKGRYMPRYMRAFQELAVAVLKGHVVP